MRSYFEVNAGINGALQRCFGIRGRPSPTLRRLQSWSHDPR
jgi:hypothetical protein